MKRSFASLSLLAVVAGAAVQLSAGPVVALVSASAYRETTIGVPITVSGVAGVTSLQFDIAFDPTIFRAGAVSGGAALAGHAVVSNTPTNNLLRVVIYSSTNGPVSNGTIATAQFTIASSAAFGLYQLSVGNVVLSDAASAAITPSPSIDGIVAVNAGIPPRLDTLERTLSGDVVFLLTGAVGQSYVLQASPDFRTWTSFSTNSVVTGSLQIKDETSHGIPWRFYRATEGY
jgi:hypothetical protein